MITFPDNFLFRLILKQSNDDAKGGKEFGVKAGFPPKDLLPMIDDTIKNCGLAGDSVTVRWSED